jgi:DNA-binding transcriptional ArsR family regulator
MLSRFTNWPVHNAQNDLGKRDLSVTSLSLPDGVRRSPRFGSILILVIELELTTDDLARLRFGFSPVWETVVSLRTLSTSGGNGLHLPWVRAVMADVRASVDLRLLTTVVPATGYIPDFLTPSLPRRVQSFTAGLEAIAATPPETVREELAYLGDDPLLDDLRARPEQALVRLTEELERYWTVAIEPYWPRIRALHQADLEYRTHELATGGVERMLRSLHPMIDFDGRRLTIRKPHCGLAGLGGRGLMLVPCAFAWPTALVLTKTPHLPTVTYSPRGVGLLWDSPGLPVKSPLSDLIGRTRAAIVAQLDLPMTTKQLACQLDLSAPTLSEHLQILKTSGVVTSRRDGRTVLYQRTALGTRLLSGSAPSTPAAPPIPQPARAR